MHAHIRDTTWRGLQSRLEVWHNGVKLDCCVEACEEGGWARRKILDELPTLSRTAEGHSRAFRMRHEEIVHGTIRFRVPGNVPERYVSLWQDKRQEVHHCEGPAHEWPDGYQVIEDVP